MRRLLHVDPGDAVPIWRQIEDGVRHLVAANTLKPGNAVPSVRELARQLKVNPATVAKAYQRLTADGALEVRRGEGTFVAERPAGAQAAERKRILKAGAARFVEAARSMGVREEEAIAAISAAWREINDAADGGTQ